jgi:hypothetical protein
VPEQAAGAAGMVGAGGALVGMGVGTAVAGLGTMIITVTVLPKNAPFGAFICHWPVCEPGAVGAIIATAMSTVPFGAVAVTAWGEAPLICSPPVKVSEYVLSHVQLPVFCKRHVFMNAWPALMTVPSGMVTSATNAALFIHATVGGTEVNVGEGDTLGGTKVDVGEGGEVGAIEGKYVAVGISAIEVATPVLSTAAVVPTAGDVPVGVLATGGLPGVMRAEATGERAVLELDWNKNSTATTITTIRTPSAAPPTIQVS